MSPLGPAIDAAVSSGHLVKRFTELPLHGLKAWSDNVPFKMDALGLVTLLGADQVSTAIGSLQRRRYTGALPLLAAFVLAGDRFTSIQPGFPLYNVTENITSTNISGWFTRWLTCQRINNATTVFEWRRRQTAPDLWRTRIIALAISCSLVMPLIICTGLMGDWYGVANAGAIVVSIAARLHILGQQRHARDWLMRPKRDQDKDIEKVCIVIRPDGKMVTLKTPGSVLNAIVRTTEPMAIHPFRYGLAQQAAWVALGTHLLVLGMCTLVTQIYTVVLFVSSTIAVSSTTDWSADTQHKTTTPRRHRRAWSNDEMITTIPFNDDWDVIKTDPARIGRRSAGISNLDKRQIAWARLRLISEEEDAMISWHLFPEMDKNPVWWEDYRTARDDFAAARHQNSDPCSPPSSSDVALQAMQPSVQSLNNSNTPAT